MDPSASYDITRLYEANFDYVLRNLRRLGVETSEVEDAVHDVFVVAHRRREAFRGESSSRTWLFGIARRVARDYRRRTYRHRRRLDAVRHASGPRTSREPPQERAAHSAVLHRFLDSLDENKRSVFILAELEQMTGREVAEALKINPNTAAARLRSARRAFELYAHDIRDADRLLAQPPAPPPEATRRRAWSLIVAELGLPGADATIATAGTGALLGHAKTVGITLALALGALAAIKLGAATLPSSASDPAPAAVSERTVASPSVARRTVAPARPTPLAEATTEPALAPAVAAASGPPRRRAPALRPSSPLPAPSAADDPSDSLAEHNRRLTEARAALDRSDPARAQQLAEDYLQRYADGFFADEIQLVRIQALGARERCPEARRAADVLARRRAGTRLAALASAVCEEGSAPPP